MPDFRNDANRVRTALYLDIDQFDKCLIALQIAEKKSVFLIEEICADLTKIESLAKKLDTELSSPNSALVRADVLQFAEGQRAKGMIINQYNLMRKLANSLGLAPNLEIIEDIAHSMGFSLSANPIIFGVVQRS